MNMQWIMLVFNSVKQRKLLAALILFMVIYLLKYKYQILEDSLEKTLLIRHNNAGHVYGEYTE